MSSDRVRLLNATSTGERPTFEDPAVDLARMDGWPPELRWRFQESATKLSTKAFEAHYRWGCQQGFGARRTIAKLLEIERNEIAVFAGEYRGRYDTAYPHTAAEISIQRYGDFGPSRHPPRRYGRPVVWPRKRGRGRHVG